MARALRRPGLIALAALVAASTLLYALAGTRVPGLWIMPDEAIYADRALSVWHHGSLPVFRGQGAGYGLLYPLVAAAPLALGGLASLKVLQALVVSLACIPVYVYGRRIMPSSWALLAAALTLASPLLLYSGFVMTEVLFYPLAALTLLAIARAVETATVRDQLVALVLVGACVLTRAQAVVFVVVLAGGALVDALLARDRARLRAFWPAWLALLAGALVAVAAPGAFGSYSSVLGGGYPLGSSLRLSLEHLAYLLVATAVIPFAALGVLFVEAARGRERDPAARALLAVTAAAVLAVCVQVGFFAARFAPHLLGRDLAALPPLLFIVFALWLARGLPRAAWVVAPVVLRRARTAGARAVGPPGQRRGAAGLARGSARLPHQLLGRRCDPRHAGRPGAAARLRARASARRDRVAGLRGGVARRDLGLGVVDHPRPCRRRPGGARRLPAQLDRPFRARRRHLHL